MAGSIRGLPFPTGTDFVVNGDNAIRALAESIDTRVPYFQLTGSTTVGTSSTQMALTAVDDPYSMVNQPTTNQIRIPAGWGGLWYFDVRYHQSGTVASTAFLRDVAANTPVIQDARTGAAGAAATPHVQGFIRVTAGQAFDLRGTVASGTVAFALTLPYGFGHFVRT